MNKPRRVATFVHRWTGLVLALFLTIVGLTGATIAWNDELERVFAPAMFLLPAEKAQRQALDVFALRDAAERAVPGYAINGVDFTRQADQPALFYVEAQPGGAEPHNDQIALDPATGKVVAQRRHGDLTQGSINLMPFLYDLHDSLALGDIGILILGIVALLWTADCFVGAYLTFPARSARARGAGDWGRRWSKSWRIRGLRPSFKFIFDLHRAGGLWLWGMLFVLAWSSVGFNLPGVYQPVMNALFGAPPSVPGDPQADASQAPRLSWRAAYARGQELMAQQAKRHRFIVQSERLMFYDPATHIYAYRVFSDRDPGQVGNTQVRFDGDNGQLRSISIPTGERAEDTVTTWLGDLHTGDVFGRAMQIALTIVGLGVAALSITGVLIWWRKMSARSLTAQRRKGADGRRMSN